MTHLIQEAYSGRLLRSLPKLMTHSISPFHIKYAETRYELRDAFTLVYDEYKRLGYITE